MFLYLVWFGRVDLMENIYISIMLRKELPNVLNNKQPWFYRFLFLLKQYQAVDCMLIISFEKKRKHVGPEHTTRM